MMAAIKDILALVEETAPAELAEEWDNVGLLVGSADAPVRKAWAALEVSSALAAAAEKAGVDLIVTHHPVIFRPLKRLTDDDPTGRILLALARAGISVISAHTNLDAADGGVNDCLARRLGLTHVGKLPGFACGRTACLPRPMTAAEAVRYIRDTLPAPRLRATALPEGMLETVALVSGAGGDGMEAAAAWGADLFLTGELKYHEATAAAERGLFAVEAGHDSTENVVVEPWLRHLQTRANALQLTITFEAAPTAVGPYAVL